MIDKKREVFIGSSKEGLKYARALRQILDIELERYGLTCTLWEDKEVFFLGKTTIENLSRKAAELDSCNGYAIMLITPDDKIDFRGEEKFIPRDNVIFELGLFMGRIGRERTFCVAPSNVKIKMMSDWAGVTNATYKYIKRPRTASMSKYLDSSIHAIKTAIDNIEHPRIITNTLEDNHLVHSVDDTKYTSNILQEIERNFGSTK